MKKKLVGVGGLPNTIYVEIALNSLLAQSAGAVEYTDYFFAEG